MSAIDDGNEIIEEAFRDCNDVIPLKVARKNQIDVMWIGRRPVVLLARLEDSLVGRLGEAQRLNKPVDKSLQKSVKATVDQTVEKTLGLKIPVFVQSPFQTTEGHLLEPVGLPLKKRVGRPSKRLVESRLVTAKDHLLKPAGLPPKEYKGQPCKMTVIESRLEMTEENGSLEPVGLPLKKRPGRPFKRPVESPLITAKDHSLKPARLPVPLKKYVPLKKRVGRPLKRPVESPLVTAKDHLLKPAELPLKKYEGRPFKMTVIESRLEMAEETGSLEPVGLPLNKRPGRPFQRPVESPSVTAKDHSLKPARLPVPLKKYVPLKKRVGRPLKRPVESPLVTAKDHLLKPAELLLKKYEGRPFKMTVIESRLEMAEETGSLEPVGLPLNKRPGRPFQRPVESPSVTAKDHSLQRVRLPVPLKESVGRPLKRQIVESTLKLAEDHSLEPSELPLMKCRRRSLKKRLGRLLKRTVESPLETTEGHSLNPTGLPLKPTGLMLKEHRPTGRPLLRRVESSLKTAANHPLKPVGLPLKKRLARPLKRPVFQPQPTKQKVPDSIQNVFEWPCCQKRVHTVTYYRECSVPLCTNNTSTCHNKHFTRVTENRRKTDASSDVFDTSHLESGMQFCEDHFNLQEDVEDDGNGYIKMLNGNFCLKPNVVPHIFKCWPSSKPRPTNSSVSNDSVIVPTTTRRASTRAKDIKTTTAITPTDTTDIVSFANTCTKSTEPHVFTNPTCTLTRSASLDAIAAAYSHCATKSGPSTMTNSRCQPNVIVPCSRLPISVKLKLKPDYQPGDVCYAKMRGYRAWPAQIDIKLGESLNDIRYRVVFFGTSQTAVCKASDIYVYNEDNTLKFSKAVRNQGAYDRAMHDLEDYVYVNGADSSLSKELWNELSPPVQIETYSEEILQCVLDTDKYSDEVVVEAINDTFVNYSFPMGQVDPLEETNIRQRSNPLRRSDAVKVETPDRVGSSALHCGQRDIFSGISSDVKSVGLKEDPSETCSIQNKTFTGNSKRKNVLKSEMTKAEHMWKFDEDSDLTISKVYCTSEISHDPLSPSGDQANETEHVKQESKKDVDKHEDLKQIECVDLESSDEEGTHIETHRNKIINASYDKFLSAFFPHKNS